MQHARDLVVNHLGCDIRDVRKFVFYPKNVVNFMAEIYIFPFIDCLLLLFNVFYHRSDREIPTAAAFVAVLSMSSSGHTKLLYIADDFTIPSKHPFHRRQDF